MGTYLRRKWVLGYCLFLVVVIVVACLGATPGSTLRLFFVLPSEIIPDRLREPHGIEPKWTVCKGNSLFAVLLLQPHDKILALCFLFLAASILSTFLVSPLQGTCVFLPIQ